MIISLVLLAKDFLNTSYNSLTDCPAARAAKRRLPDTVWVGVKLISSNTPESDMIWEEPGYPYEIIGGYTKEQYEHDKILAFKTEDKEEAVRILKVRQF